MATLPLVNADLELGRATVEAIEGAGIPFRLAIWAHFPEAEEWRLMIVTPLVNDEGPRDAYASVQRAIRGKNVLPLDRLVIVGPTDPLAKLAANSLKASGPPLGQGAVAVTSTTTSTGTIDVLYADSKKRP
jgi:hypothetical protein